MHLGALVATMTLLTTSLAPAQTSAEGGGREQRPKAEPRASSITGPTRARLGVERSVELQVVASRIPDAIVAPEPRLFTNVGEVRGLRAQGPGRWTFEYILPMARYPQVALLAAYDDRGHRLATHRIELLASPEIDIQSEPRVSVLVRAGGQSFGPVRTDGGGRSRLQIVVPPGIGEVTTVATDGYGNVTEGTLALDTPVFSRLLVLCASQESALYVLSLDEHGAFAQAPTFSVDAPGARTSPAVALGPGVFRIAVTAELAEKQQAEAQLRVSLDGEVRSCSLRLSPSPSQARPSPTAQTSKPVVAAASPHLLLGIQLGANSNFARVAGPWGALHVGLPLRRAANGFRLEAELAYTRSTSQLGKAAAEPLDLTLDSWPVSGGLRYLLAVGRWQYGAAVSSGIDLVNVRVRRESSTETSWAYPLLLGGALSAGFSLPHAELRLELGYTHAYVNTGTVQGNAGGWRATLGYLFQL
jgi:hypothetical protein